MKRCIDYVMVFSTKSVNHVCIHIHFTLIALGNARIHFVCVLLHPNCLIIGMLQWLMRKRMSAHLGKPLSHNNLNCAAKIYYFSQYQQGLIICNLASIIKEILQKYASWYTNVIYSYPKKSWFFLLSAMEKNLRNIFWS